MGAVSTVRRRIGASERNEGQTRIFVDRLERCGDGDDENSSLTLRFAQREDLRRDRNGDGAGLLAADREAAAGADRARDAREVAPPRRRGRRSRFSNWLRFARDPMRPR